jgi:tetratricopeptide (TPR) repeat protein
MPKGDKTIRYPACLAPSRILPICALVLSLALAAVAVAADDPDAVWKGMFAAAVRASGARDFAAAEDILTKAVTETQRFPPGDARQGLTLNTLGLVYKEEKKYAEAEKAFRKAIDILEKAYGPETIDFGNVNFNLAGVLIAEGHWESALPLIQASQTIYRKILGDDSLKVASTLCMTGEVYLNLKKYYLAEEPLKHCADSREASGGMQNAEFADALSQLGLVYVAEGKYALADPVFKLVEKIREVTAGITSIEFAEALETHAALLRTMGRVQDADRDATMAAAVRRSAKK